MVSQFLIYSMKSAMTLVMLYVPYIFMLQKEKFFSFNRRILLGIIFISLVLPLLNVSWLSVDDVPVVQATHQQMVDVGIPVNMGEYRMESEHSSLPAFESAKLPVSVHSATSISWFDILAIMFFVGMVISIIIRSFQLGILSYVIKHKSLWEKKLENGIRICCRKGRISTYSWMKTIVISEEDWNDGQHEIILHESGHILAHHSYDMLLLMMCQAVQWYNPFAWLVSRSLSEVHEYEADQYVLEHGVSSSEYMMMLLRKLEREQNYSFVNGFNNNSIKRRVLMMKETAKSPWRRMKVIYILPVCLVALCAFATQKVTAPLDEMLETLEAKDVVRSIKESADEIVEMAENDSIAETAPTQMFVIEGTVDPSITDSCYNVYVSDDYFHIKMDKPDMCVPVVDKKFHIEIPTDKVKAGRIRCIFPGGELCSDWIEFFVVPGETLDIAVKKGTYWRNGLTYGDNVRKGVLAVRKSNPSLKTPYTPHIKGKVWKSVERGLADNKSLYVNQVIFDTDATVLHIMTDDFYNNIYIWPSSYIEDEQGNRYDLMRADVGGIDDYINSEMRVFGGYYYFKPVPKGTKLIRFFNGNTRVPAIAAIREGGSKKKKDNFKLNLTVSKEWEEAGIEILSDNNWASPLHGFTFDENNKGIYSAYLNRPYKVVLASKKDKKGLNMTWHLVLMPNELMNVDIKGDVVTIGGSEFYNQFGEAYKYFSEYQKRILDNKPGVNNSVWEYFKQHVNEKGCVMFFDINEIYSESTIAKFLQEPLRSSEYGKYLLKRDSTERARLSEPQACVSVNGTILKNVGVGNEVYRVATKKDFARIAKVQPDEIESVAFLSDAAAIAIYGNEARVICKKIKVLATT